MNAPTTPHTQPLPGITCMRFSLLRFRSPLLSESQLFSLPMGTEMFHFPTFPPHTLFHSGAGNRTQLRLGSPIRTPPDHSSVANSPGLIAGSNVLHRLLMPRHPPCALHSLPNTNTQQKQQRHTLQKQTPTHDKPPTPQTKQGHRANGAGDARVHYPEIKQQETNQAPHGNPPGPPGSDASEPQQCALRTTPTNDHPPFHTPTTPEEDSSCSTRETGHPARWSFVDDSTIRTPPSPHRTDAGASLPHQGAGVCSLERR